MKDLIRHERRTFCKSIGTFMLGASALSQAPLALGKATVRANPGVNIGVFVSATSNKQDQHFLIITDHLGKLKHQIALPGRGHHIAADSNSGLLAIPARRPGRFMLIVDTTTGEIKHQLTAESGFHFYGHAIFSRDGRYLYTTENHHESGEGKIVIRDAQQQFRVSQIFSSYGIGPHELILSQDENTIIVANGGIETHPDAGRAKLNLDSMAPSLVYVNHYTGELVEKWTLPESLHQLSIRHIDLNNRGQVAIAMQFEGDKTESVPLVALHDRGSPIKALWAPEFINQKMQHYCGSVQFNRSGSVFAVTSPRGNLITFWDAVHGEYISSFECTDVCGVSQADQHDFVFSNGLGEVFSFDFSKAKLNKIKKLEGLAWDNHLNLV